MTGLRSRAGSAVRETPAKGPRLPLFTAEFVRAHVELAVETLNRSYYDLMDLEIALAKARKEPGGLHGS